MLNCVLAVVSDLSPHVVDEEGLGEVVFIVGERHGLEVKGHHGTGFDVAELVAAGRGVAISVEELGHGGAVLREVRILATGIPLLIVVKNVVSGRGEKLVELLVLEDLIKDPNLVDGGLGTLVSDSSESCHGEEGKVKLPDEGLVEHQEGEAGVGDQGAGPAVIHSVEARVDLVEVVSGTHSPLPEIILEDVVAVGELARVALGL